MSIRIKKEGRVFSMSVKGGHILGILDGIGELNKSADSYRRLEKAVDGMTTPVNSSPRILMEIGNGEISVPVKNVLIWAFYSYEAGINPLPEMRKMEGYFPFIKFVRVKSCMD